MTPTVTAALRTRARAEVRCEVALDWYRHERRMWRLDDSTPEHRALSRVRANTARARWSTLHDLLAADAVETTVAA